MDVPPPVTLHLGDNLPWLEGLEAGSADLIYMDPPFFSQRDYGDFSDNWKSLQEYLDFIEARLMAGSRVLSPKGSIWLHCDDRASHHLRILMDAVFGSKSYKNTITWKRTGAHSNARRFGRISDHILYYARPGGVWNPQYIPYSSQYISSCYEDEGGKYRGVLLTASGVSTTQSGEPWRGYDPASCGKGRHWSVSRKLCKELGIDTRLPSVEKLERLDAAGYILWSTKEGGPPNYKQYLSLHEGTLVQDIWDDIRGLGVYRGDRSESVDYATQKPLALLERIIKASSNEGDMVLDPFCGSGTTVVAATKLGRRAMACDTNPKSIEVTRKRLNQ